jgi:hypothetical protein
MSSSDDICVDADNNINYNFLGLKENINKEHIIKVFDTNYIPLNSLPISYFNTSDPIVTDDNDELLTLLQKINNKKNIYNTYNITPIFISVIIVIILGSLAFMRILFITYNEFYSYILIVSLTIPIIVLSLWFVYINNQSL